jgi:hypothetical protein
MKTRAVFLAAAVLWALFFANNLSAQGTIAGSGRPSINIGTNNVITWEGPDTSSVYVQVDYEAPRIFAVGRSGVQSGSWIMQGHLYVFTLRDANGKELARDQKDLRTSDRR